MKVNTFNFTADQSDFVQSLNAKIQFLNQENL